MSVATRSSGWISHSPTTRQHGMLQVSPSTLEVDYDKNLTALYASITDQNWDRAISICEHDPIQAATWVVRHYHDENELEDQPPEIMWRFLPLHSACARQPPAAVVIALLKAYPDAAKCIDDQGMFALHYACGNQAEKAVIGELLNAHSDAAGHTDPRGMLPIHYTTCWGPASVGVVNMLLASFPGINTKDHDGNTPLDLALEGEYAYKSEVISAIRNWSGSLRRRSNSHGSDYSDAIRVDALPSKSSQKSSKSSLKSGRRSVETTATRQSRSDSPAQSREGREVRSQQRQSPPAHQSSSKSSGREVDSQSIYSRSTVQGRYPSPSRTPPEEKSAYSFSKGRDARGDSPVSTRSRVNSSRSHASSAARSSSIRFSTGSKGPASKDVPDSMEQKIIDKTKELEAVTEELEKTRRELASRDAAMQRLSLEVDDTKMLWQQSVQECKGLRVTLGDMMDEHELTTRKSEKTLDRLSSLSLSLDSMMEQQALLTKCVQSRNDRYKSTTNARNELFRQLSGLDRAVESDETDLESTLAKQTHEMEAIAAVIKAARD